MLAGALGPAAVAALHEGRCVSESRTQVRGQACAWRAVAAQLLLSQQVTRCMRCGGIADDCSPAAVRGAVRGANDIYEGHFLWYWVHAVPHLEVGKLWERPGHIPDNDGPHMGRNTLQTNVAVRCVNVHQMPT